MTNKITFNESEIIFILKTYDNIDKITIKSMTADEISELIITKSLFNAKGSLLKGSMNDTKKAIKDLLIRHRYLTIPVKRVKGRFVFNNDLLYINNISDLKLYLSVLKINYKIEVSLTDLQGQLLDIINGSEFDKNTNIKTLLIGDKNLIFLNTDYIDLQKYNYELESYLYNFI